MLESLRIANFALIVQASLNFSGGFSAITGETGAGKSVLLCALRCVLGERTGPDMVRPGTPRAMIEAGFRGPHSSQLLSLLDQYGLLPDTEDDPHLLVLRREILASGGTSRNFINGRAATVAQLREIGSYLVDLHAQHENGRLFHPSEQLSLLDSFGDCQDTLQQYHHHWHILETTTANFRRLQSLATEAQRQIDFLRFQVEELEKAEILPEEEAELEQEKRRLASVERLATLSSEAVDLLIEGERATPVAELLRQVARLTAELATLDPNRQDIASDGDQLRYLATDLGERLRDFGAQLAADPNRLQWVDDRLSLLRSLRRKYQAPDTASLLLRLQELRLELQRVENVEDELHAAQNAYLQALQHCRHQAEILSRLRQEAAADFETLVGQEMAELELPGALLQVQLSSRLQAPPSDSAQGLGPHGADDIEFLVAINPGNPPQPLRKVASGGEVARIMLAIKCVLATADEVPTLVFDEIDVGISGQAAARVGEKLAALGTHHQLLCITHLPQVAARATTHWLVEKFVRDNQTQSQIRELQPQERTHALATMLSGTQPNDEALRYAQKLLTRKKTIP